MTKFIIGLCLLTLQSFACAKSLEERTSETPEFIGDMFAAALMDQEYDAIDERFDRALFAEKIIRQMNVRGTDAESFRDTVVKNLSLQIIFGNNLKGHDYENMDVKTVAVVNRDNQQIPIVRMLVSGGGANYYELSLQKKNGKYFIDDVFVLANAQFMSETMAQTLMASFGKGSWGTSFNLNADDRIKLSKIFTDVMQYKKVGDYAGAYSSFKNLPEPMLAIDTIHLAVIMTAIHLDENIYRAELSDFAKRHGNNPRYTFLLIDHYIFTKEYDKALKNIDTLLQRYRNDAALMMMKVGVYVTMDDRKKAHQALQTAVSYEPDYEDAYWSGVTLSIEQKDYEAAITWLKAYEQQFDYDFAAENFHDQELYKGFIKSKEFKRWMKAKH